MSACGRASPSRPVLVRPGLREPVSVWPLSHGLTVVGAVFPGSAALKPASCRLAGRSRQPRSSTLTHSPYSHLPEWPGTAIPGSSFDPGRDMLCILTSPPQWLQWP
jgi:hypothetical protein